MTCDHSASHSGGLRYLRSERQLRAVLVCDRCGAERVELKRITYVPNARRFAGHLAELTARELGLSDAQVVRLRVATLVCGVGPDQTLIDVSNKPGPLSKQEWILVRRQPELAAALFNDRSFDDIREWILCHRERPDGRGYPRGLSGGQIPLEARILSVSEAYAAMTSERPYKLALDHESACLELVRCAGTQFDAAVVQAFLRASMRSNVQPAVAAA